jgi:four helix bundle protein
MPYKFENPDVWQLALDYIDLVYKIAEGLPRSEEYNLKSRITSAATAVVLNIAEGSQGRSNAEQDRFLGMAIRSLIETVACQQIIKRRNYFQDMELLQKMYIDSHLLVRKLQSFRNSLSKTQYQFGKIFPMKMMFCCNVLIWSIVHGRSSPQVPNG